MLVQIVPQIVQETWVTTTSQQKHGVLPKEVRCFERCPNQGLLKVMTL